MWTHGFHPFNKDDINDIKLLENWKVKSNTSDFYKGAINVWTISDVEKRNTAKQNNLNYLEIFSINTDIVINTIVNKLSEITI